MKKLFAVIGLTFLFANAPASFADTHPAVVLDSSVVASMATVVPFDLINWKVGDEAVFDVTIGAFGKMGKNVKKVTKDEGTAIWINQNIDLGFQKENVDILLNKADGKVLKMVRNGKEEAIPNDKVEIISQDATEITVPAGTFKVIHIVAKTEKVSKLEVWANPRDTVMDGTVKQVVNTGMFDLTMELASFKKN